MGDPDTLIQTEMLELNLIAGIYFLRSNKTICSKLNHKIKELSYLKHLVENQLPSPEQDFSRFKVNLNIFNEKGHSKGSFSRKVSKIDLKQVTFPLIFIPYKHKTDIFMSLSNDNINIVFITKEHHAGIEFDNMILLKVQTSIDVKEKKIYQEFISVNKSLSKYLGSCMIQYSNELAQQITMEIKEFDQKDQKFTNFQETS